MFTIAKGKVSSVIVCACVRVCVCVCVSDQMEGWPGSPTSHLGGAHFRYGLCRTWPTAHRGPEEGTSYPISALLIGMLLHSMSVRACVRACVNECLSCVCLTSERESSWWPALTQCVLVLFLFARELKVQLV